MDIITSGVATSEDVIDKYKDMVYRIAITHVGNRVDADDIFQEVFLRYVRKTIVFESEEHRKSWFIRVTINCSKKHYSSSWLKKTIPLKDIVSDSISNENHLVYETLLTLPKKYKTALFLFYFEKMPVSEICSVTGVKESTIRSQLTRGREMIRNILKGGYFNE